MIKDRFPDTISSHTLAKRLTYYSINNGELTVNNVTLKLLTSIKTTLQPSKKIKNINYMLRTVIKTLSFRKRDPLLGISLIKFVEYFKDLEVPGIEAFSRTVNRIKSFVGGLDECEI